MFCFKIISGTKHNSLIYLVYCFLDGLQIMAIVEILQTPLGLQNLDTSIAYRQFYRIKGGGGVHPPPPPTITFDRVDEIQKFFMNSALGQAWSRNHNIFKCHKLLLMGEGGTLHLHILFCEIMCHD